MLSSPSSDTKRPRFPSTFDSTMIGTFRSCPQKMFRMYVEHWKPQAESVHLIAGGAFAEGVEVARREFYIEGKPPQDAVAAGLGALLRKYGTFECPADSAKSPLRMAGALEYYFAQYPLGGDGAEPIEYGGKRGIEFSFAHPLPVNHPETGDPILYTGRADMIANAYKGVFVYDEKTTSSLGQSWLKQWDHRSQFTGYCWALRQFGIQPAGVVVRGISILKTKYECAQAISYRAPWEIDRWLDQVVRDIERAKRMWAEGYWDYNLDHACTEYSGCALTRVCKVPDPERWLPMSFTQRVWDPLAREEVPISEWEARWAPATSLTAGS